MTFHGKFFFWLLYFYGKVMSFQLIRKLYEQKIRFRPYMYDQLHERRYLFIRGFFFAKSLVQILVPTFFFLSFLTPHSNFAYSFNFLSRLLKFLSIEIKIFSKQLRIHIYNSLLSLHLLSTCSIVFDANFAICSQM